MYPLSENLFAPLNSWYVAAWSDEITAAPMERWLLEQPVVFYRRSNGTATALDGRCPHRHFPLAKGRVVEDNLQCGYHGLVFAPDGRCLRVPSQPFAPAACNIVAHPVVDDGTWVWIWPGDPARADLTLLPHTAVEGFRTAVRAYRRVCGRYMLLHDNLLDLSHLEYLHAGGIGSAGAAEVLEHRTQGEDWVKSEREQVDAPCPPHFQALFGYSGPVTRRFGMTCHVPALHVGYDEFAGPAGPLGRFRVCHAITPGRKGETHYFVAASRDFALDDKALTQGMNSALGKTLDEDVAATEAIEQMITSLREEPRDVLVRGDATCVTGRRLFESMIRRELQGR
jgi:vanillate O-demethylase monooxygenase subunit